MKEKNKIDLWINLLLNASVLMFIPLIFVVPADEQYIMFISLAFMALLIYPLFYGYCELQEEQLYIRIGFFRQRIKYDKIKSLKLVTNFLSSMAMTKDRIEIKVHGKGYILGTTHIGPVNREEFIDELRRRCYNLDEQK